MFCSLFQRYPRLDGSSLPLKAVFSFSGPLLTTNLVFSAWERIFKDPMTTLAAIDRVVHHSVVLDLMAVESYRARAAKATKKAPLQAAAG